MKDLIEVFRMSEIDAKVRCRIIIQLGHAINFQYGSNITEPLVYELVKQLDPDNKEVETEHYKSILKLKQQEAKNGKN